MISNRENRTPEWGANHRHVDVNRCDGARAKVDELHQTVFCNEDIRALYVAREHTSVCKKKKMKQGVPMNDAFAMQILEACQHLSNVHQKQRLREETKLLHHIVQRAALHEAACYISEE